MLYLEGGYKQSTQGSITGPPVNHHYQWSEADGRVHSHQVWGDTKLAGLIMPLRARLPLKGTQDGLEEQANRNFVKFSKNKYKVLALGRKSPLQQYQLEATRLENSSAPQGTWWSCWAVSWTRFCSVTLHTSIPGNCHRHTTGRLERVIISSRRPHLATLSGFGCTSNKNDNDQLEGVQQCVTKMVRSKSTCPVRRECGTRACSAWKRGSFGEI